MDLIKNESVREDFLDFPNGLRIKIYVTRRDYEGDVDWNTPISQVLEWFPDLDPGSMARLFRIESWDILVPLPSLPAYIMRLVRRAPVDQAVRAAHICGSLMCEAIALRIHKPTASSIKAIERIEARQRQGLPIFDGPVESNYKAIPTSKGREAQVVDDLRKRLGGEKEVECPVGRIDLLTNDLLIEVKTGRSWKGALGQVLAYSLYFPDHAPALFLFDLSKDLHDMVKSTCEKFGVKVMTRMPSSAKS